MRLVGIGVDLLGLDRFNSLIHRRGALSVARRILSRREMDQFHLEADKTRFLQSRFAVKEALFKAASSHRRLLWSDVSVIKTADNKPEVVFEKACGLTAQVSLSHDQGFLVAMALVMEN